MNELSDLWFVDGGQYVVDILYNEIFIKQIQCSEQTLISSRCDTVGSWNNVGSGFMTCWHKGDSTRYLIDFRSFNIFPILVIVFTNNWSPVICIPKCLVIKVNLQFGDFDPVKKYFNQLTNYNNTTNIL